MKQKLYRDTKNGWISGICAGLARKHALPVFLVRLFTILMVLSPMAPLVIISYIIGTFAIPIRPDIPEAEAETIRQSIIAAPSNSFGNIRHRMRELEHRIRKMETFVTSTEYQFIEEQRSSRN